MYEKLYKVLIKKDISHHKAVRIVSNEKFIEKNIDDIMYFINGKTSPEYFYKKYKMWYMTQKKKQKSIDW